MYTQIEAEEAEKELAHIETAKKAVLALIQEKLGGIIDAVTYNHEISYINAAYDGLVEKNRLACERIIENYESQEAQRHNRSEGTFYAGSMYHA